MIKECIGRGIGKEIYQITGDFVGLTYQEIADACDRNNWGYAVRSATPEKIVIVIYTD